MFERFLGRVRVARPRPWVAPAWAWRSPNRWSSFTAARSRPPRYPARAPPSASCCRSPRMAAGPAGEPRTAEARADRAPGVTRLLVADDSETVLLMLQRPLEMAGLHEVNTATDGEEALERSGGRRRTASPDLILLDAMMPNMRTSPGSTRRSASCAAPGCQRPPILIIPAALDAQEPERMNALGADDYVPKPFDLDPLIGRIEELARGASGCRRPRPRVANPSHDRATSIRICFPLSLVPSRNSTALLGLLRPSSTKEKRSRTRIVVDRLLGDHRALRRRPAQVLLVDAAALAAVDEQLHVASRRSLASPAAPARSRRRGAARARGAPRAAPTRRSGP